MIGTEKTFSDLVTALQTIAYATGQYTNETTVNNIESISLSLFSINETLERIADAMEEKQLTMLEKFPGTDMTTAVQASLDRK